MRPGSRPQDDGSSSRELDDLTLRRAQKGDAHAARELVERYQHPVFALLDRLLCGAGKRSLVEDLAQETFLRVFRALPRFAPAGPARLSGWILTIAARLALDELRRRPVPRAALAAVTPLPASLEEVTATRALAAAVRRAAAALPAESRAVLVLRDFHDLEYREIAAALDLDLGTVKSRLHRARAAIRAAVGEASDDGEASHD